MTALTSSSVISCSRCGKSTKLGKAERTWNAVYEKGYVVGFLCGLCQTPDENAEAVINEATIDYTAGGIDAFGRAWGKPKAAGR